MTTNDAKWKDPMEGGHSCSGKKRSQSRAAGPKLFTGT